MRHLGNVFLIYIGCVTVTISQYFLTGIYGRLIFLPLLCVAVGFYAYQQYKGEY